ncbi:MAG: hypothetical protein HRT71_06770 [Flavobacteriales bacterium]|nr:hypothetical protein [Flavobacteriales bacterium]
MKKLVVLLLVAVAAISLLSACGGGHGSAYRCPAYGHVIVNQAEIPS